MVGSTDAADVHDVKVDDRDDRDVVGSSDATDVQEMIPIDDGKVPSEA